MFNQIVPERDLSLANSEATYSDIFDEPIEKLAITGILLKLLVFLSFILLPIITSLALSKIFNACAFRE